MAKFEGDDARDRYRKLMARCPELARNPGGAGVEILLQPDDIARATDAARRSREARGYMGDDYRSGVLADDVHMTVVRDAVRFGDGSLGLYNRIIEGPCVAVLPLLAGRPVLIRIFRHGLRDWFWELPRGDVTAGESLSDAAKREVQEEIGAKVGPIIDLGPFTPGGASLAITAHLFLAEVDRLGRAARAESITEIRPVSVEELGDMIADGRIIDGFTIALFARARLKSLI